MTAGDARLDAIQAREALVHVKCADCAKCRAAEEDCWCPECEYWGCERGPDCEDDPNPTDVAFLLAELREAHEAERVARFMVSEREAELLNIKGPCRAPGCRLHYAHRGPCAAVAAANGDGEDA